MLKNTQGGVLSGKMHRLTAKLGIAGYNAARIAGVKPGEYTKAEQEARQAKRGLWADPNRPRTGVG